MKKDDLVSFSTQESRTPKSKQKEVTSESNSKKDSKKKKKQKKLGEYGTWVVVEPYEVPFIVMTDPDEYQELYTSLTGEPCDKVYVSAGLALALSHSQIGNMYLMYLPKKYDEETTWHECLHMTHIMMEAMGITVKGFDDEDGSSSETQAYLQGYMVKRIKEEVYPKKKRAPKKAPPKTQKE